MFGALLSLQRLADFFSCFWLRLQYWLVVPPAEIAQPQLLWYCRGVVSCPGFSLHASFLTLHGINLCKHLEKKACIVDRCIDGSSMTPNYNRRLYYCINFQEPLCNFNNMVTFYIRCNLLHLTSRNLFEGIALANPLNVKPPFAERV